MLERIALVVAGIVTALAITVVVFTVALSRNPLPMCCWCKFSRGKKQSGGCTAIQDEPEDLFQPEHTKLRKWGE